MFGSCALVSLARETTGSFPNRTVYWGCRDTDLRDLVWGGERPQFLAGRQD